MRAKETKLIKLSGIERGKYNKNMIKELRTLFLKFLYLIIKKLYRIRKL